MWPPWSPGWPCSSKPPTSRTLSLILPERWLLRSWRIGANLRRRNGGCGMNPFFRFSRVLRVWIVELRFECLRSSWCCRNKNCQDHIKSCSTFYQLMNLNVITCLYCHMFSFSCALIHHFSSWLCSRVRSANRTEWFERASQLLENLSNHPDSQPFMTPVDISIYNDYLKYCQVSNSSSSFENSVEYSNQIIK